MSVNASKKIIGKDKLSSDSSEKFSVKDLLESRNVSVQDIETEEAEQQQSDDGISILVKLVKAGRLDPWNIDIVDITDKYLSHLIQMKSNNLRLTGKTLLFAAVLLKLKSNILEGVDITDFESEVGNGFEDDFDEDIESYEDESLEYINRNNVISIDDVLERRTSIRLNRSRVVTLKDLIRQLKFYEQLDKKRTLKDQMERSNLRKIRSYAKFTADDIINIAHDEYIEKSVEKLNDALIKIFQTQEEITIEALTLIGLDKISAYIALLFLCAKEDYELVQDEFYGQLYVKKEVVDAV